MVFVDASSNMEEHNLKVFILCTHSVAGALPIGLILCSDENTETLEKALKMYKTPFLNVFWDLIEQIY